MISNLNQDTGLLCLYGTDHSLRVNVNLDELKERITREVKDS